MHIFVISKWGKRQWTPTMKTYLSWPRQQFERHASPRPWALEFLFHCSLLLFCVSLSYWSLWGRGRGWFCNPNRAVGHAWMITFSFYGFRRDQGGLYPGQSVQRSRFLLFSFFQKNPVRFALEICSFSKCKQEARKVHDTHHTQVEGIRRLFQEGNRHTGALGLASFSKRPRQYCSPLMSWLIHMMSVGV